jgi:3-oxoacyl-ACP reductase-like protein
MQLLFVCSIIANRIGLDWTTAPVASPVPPTATSPAAAAAAAAPASTAATSGERTRAGKFLELLVFQARIEIELVLDPNAPKEATGVPTVVLSCFV